MSKFLDKAPGVKAAMLGDLAMRRLVDPEEVADVVVFLASSSASYVNGIPLSLTEAAHFSCQTPSSVTDVEWSRWAPWCLRNLGLDCTSTRHSTLRIQAA